MNWSAICSTIASVIAAATGLPAVWAYEPRPVFDTPYMVLTVIGERIFGRDERHREYNEDDDLLDRHTAGQRGINVSIQCRALDQRSGYDSKHYVTKAANSLGLESVIETLAAANISIISIGQMTAFNTTVNDRVENIANVDVEFGATADVTDTQVSFFEHFEITEAEAP